jgi:hypothetical protein
MRRLHHGFVLLLIIWSTGSAQRSPDQELLLQKSQEQKKGAWTCLATGTALLITAIAIPRGDLEGYSVNTLYTDREYRNDEIKSLTGLAGITCAAASIPLFIASARHHRRVLSLELRSPGSQQGKSWKRHPNTPALTLTMRF